MSSNASILRHKVLLQRRTPGTPNSFNEAADVWENVAVLAASYEPLYGREYFLGANLPQKDAQFDATIRIRMRKGINPAEHQIVYDGIVHDIVSVAYDRERRQTQLRVKARASGQTQGSKVNV